MNWSDNPKLLDELIDKEISIANAAYATGYETGVATERERIVAALRQLDAEEDREPGAGPGACGALADDIGAGLL